jgi:glutaredoxin
LDKAEQSVKAALEQCPQSKEAKALLDSIESRKKEALNLLQRAKNSWSAALFAEAQREIGAAKTAWKDNSVIGEFESTISPMEATYKKYISEAEENRKSRRFAVAQTACHNALSACPNSAEAKTLLNAINIEENKWEEAKDQWTNMVKAVMRWVVAVVPGVIGFYLFWKADFSFHVGLLGFISEKLTFTVGNWLGASLTGIALLAGGVKAWGGKLHERIFAQMPFEELDARFFAVSLILIVVGLALTFIGAFSGCLIALVAAVILFFEG